ncbi:MAG: dethiobiotin synthase, partial [Pseudomonadota bacterium]
MKGLFVTGTDTDVGKTLVSSLLSTAFAQKERTTYFKPIQSGRPTDVETVRSLACHSVEIKNPFYEFKAPMSPN